MLDLFAGHGNIEKAARAGLNNCRATCAPAPLRRAQPPRAFASGAIVCSARALVYVLETAPRFVLENSGITWSFSILPWG